jgi:hypothetical protein
MPGVWAAGDVANYPDQIFHRRMRVEHWDNAVEQGRVAMRNMMGKLQPFIHVPYFFSDAFDLSYEFWGDADGHDQVVYRGNMDQKQISVWWLKRQRLCAALIMNRPEEERAVAPRWILRRPRLDPKALQNARNLKSLDTTFRSQGNQRLIRNGVIANESEENCKRLSCRLRRRFGWRPRRIYAATTESAGRYGRCHRHR